MENLDITIALSHSADFDDHTWTFQPIEKSYKVRAGTYAIVHKPDLDKHIQDIAIAFYCDRLGIDRNEKLMSVSKDGVISWKTIEESFSDFISQR